MKILSVKNKKEETQMKILDIFSWIPETEITLEEIMAIFENYKNGITSNEYMVTEDLPADTSQNIIIGKEQLITEGKRVAFIIKDSKILALIGYNEQKRRLKDDFNKCDYLVWNWLFSYKNCSENK